MKHSIFYALLAIFVTGLSSFSPAKEALLPDLTFGAITSNCRKGEIYVQVKNEGRATSKATSLQTFGRSPEALPCLPNVENHRDNIPALAVGATATVTVKLAFNGNCTCRAGLPSRSLYYTFAIDPDNLVQEENKVNNNFNEAPGFYIYLMEQ